MLKKMDSKERFLHLRDGENYKKLVIKIMWCDHGNRQTGGNY